MKLLRQLVGKDLRRAWRNPLPWLLNLAMPLVLTALLGLVFGGRGSSSGSAIGRIRVAVVDEDDSLLTGLLRGAANQDEVTKHLELSFPDRTNAIRSIQENQLAAVVVIPNGFTTSYLRGSSPATIELIKNPAQSIHPALVEEGLGMGVGFLNAASRILGSLLPDLDRQLAQGGRPDFKSFGRILETVGERVERIRPFLDPPLIWYDKSVKESGAAKNTATQGNIMAYLLPGMASAFLLFLADVAMRDLFREQSGRTLHRFATLRRGIFPMVAGKVLFAIAMVWVGSVILFGGGGLLFSIHWANPLALAGLLAAYGVLGAGLLSLLCGLAGSERRSSVLNSMLVMTVAFAGGSYFPSSQLPAFVRENLSPWMPNHWFIEAVRDLQQMPDGPWAMTAVKLVVVGAAMVVAASALLQRRLQKGGAR